MFLDIILPIEGNPHLLLYSTRHSLLFAPHAPRALCMIRACRSSVEGRQRDGDEGMEMKGWRQREGDKEREIKWKRDVRNWRLDCDLSESRTE